MLMEVTTLTKTTKVNKDDVEFEIFRCALTGSTDSGVKGRFVIESEIKATLEQFIPQVVGEKRNIKFTTIQR